MKKFSQSRRSEMLVALVFGMVSLLGSVTVAQSGAKTEPATPAAEAVPANEKIVGTWAIHLEKSKEIMSEENFKMMSQLGDGGIKLVFGADGEFSMSVTGAPASGVTTYAFDTIDGEDNLYAIVVTQPDNPPLLAKLSFMDDDTLKFMPEGEDPAVMVREAAADASGKKMAEE